MQFAWRQVFRRVDYAVNCKVVVRSFEDIVEFELGFTNLTTPLTGIGVGANPSFSFYCCNI